MDISLSLSLSLSLYLSICLSISHFSGVLAPDRVLSMGQIELN